MEPGTIMIIVSALLAISEGLTLIPGIKSNGIFQLVFFILRTIKRGIETKEV